MENKNSLNIILFRISIVGLVASILLVGIISYASLISSEKLSSIGVFPFGDKGAHIVAYAVLGIFLYFSFSRISFKLYDENNDLIASNWIILPSFLTIITGLLVGTILEVIQKSVSRSFEVLDIVADGLGLLVGCTIAYYILKGILKIAIIKEL